MSFRFMKYFFKSIFIGIGCFSTSCSLGPKTYDDTHIVSTDSFGLYYPPPNRFSNGDLTESNRLLEVRMARLNRDFRAHRGVKEVMIFVHGGLTGQGDGIKGAIDKLQRMVDDHQTDIFPIFITWDSDLMSSYKWHVFRDANGITDISNRNNHDELRGIGRAPFLFVSDVASGVANTPKTFYNATAKSLQNFDPLFKSTPDVYFTRSHYESILRDLANNHVNIRDAAYHFPDQKSPFEFSLGADINNADSFTSSAFSCTFLPLTIALSPLYDGLGRPAWENMLRRSKTLVYRHPTLLDLRDSDSPKADGVIPRVLRQVRAWQKSNDALKVTFVGHSMGTIALNEAFRAMDDDNNEAATNSCAVRVDKVIYMASACSIRDFNDTVGQYMKRNSGCETYALCLHPKRDVGEKFLPYLPLVYSGSLLTWIDEFFQNPRDFNDRTFGSFENCIVAYKHLPQTSQFHLKAFTSNESFFNRIDVDSGPQKHGEFSRFKFWDPKFYKPVSPQGPQPTYQVAETANLPESQ